MGQQQVHELLMIAREALFNAILHGHPGSIEVQMQYTARVFELLIRDDGRGFDSLADFSDDHHYGLQGMKERVERLGGTLAIESRPSLGTSVLATLPRAALIPADNDAMLAL